MGALSDFIPTPEAPGLTLISTQTVTSPVAAIDITAGIDGTFDKYEIHATGVRDLPGNGSLVMQTSGDAGATFDTGSTAYSYVCAFIGTNTTSYSRLGSDNAEYIYLSTGLNVPGATFDGVISIFGSQESRITTFSGQMALTGGGESRQINLAGARKSSSVVNGVRFTTNDSASLGAGTFRLYGVKK